MYTDTKNTNIANCANNGELTYARLQAGKSKGRLGKMWKPLLRLITSSKSETQKHPNNINLNNATPQVQLEAIMPALTVELPTKTLPTDEELQQWNMQTYSQYTKAQEESHIVLIKSASIEKTPAHSQNCIYGRNCQDLHHDHSDSSKVFLSTTNEQTLVWNAEEQKLDEELLKAWYFYHYRQFPIQASLC